jgi:hypothetical protein
MKYLVTILSIILFASFTHAQQIRGKGEITKKERKVGGFHSVKIGGAQDVMLMQGDEYTIVIETNENLHEHITVVNEDSLLYVQYKDIKYYDKLKLYITAPSYRSINVSGASDVVNSDTLTGEHLQIMASGASDVKLTVNYKRIVSRASGSSDITLMGKSDYHKVTATGASDVIAKNMENDTTILTASGASTCFVNASNSLTYKASGASSVKYVGQPETLIMQDNKGTKNVVVISDTVETGSVYHYYDTTAVNLGIFDVEVIDGDTTKVSVGRHQIIVDDEGNVKYRKKRKKFNGHWGGVELGINGYVTPDFNTKFSTTYDKDYNYLSLRYEKSIAVNLNIFEANIPFNKDKNMGLVTGIGLAWNNYRFSQPTYLTPDSSEVYGFYMEGASVRKTKLTAMYITIPLFYEIQTKSRRWKMFHFGIGGLISARVRTHTKIYYNQANQPYLLVDPNSDFTQESNTPGGTNRNIVKQYNSFHLPPFKFDAMVRIGYSVINLFATYSLNQMWQDGRGPEMNRWTMGIMLVGW